MSTPILPLDVDESGAPVDPVSIVAGARARGATLEAAGDRLIVTAPDGALTDGQWRALSDHKPAVLRLLMEERSSAPPVEPTDADQPASPPAPQSGPPSAEVLSQWRSLANRCYRILRQNHFTHDQAMGELRRLLPTGDPDTARAFLADLEVWPPDPCDLPLAAPVIVRHEPEQPAGTAEL